MKIIQLIQKPQRRGAEIFACQLSDHLTKLKYEVIVISIFPGDAILPLQSRLIKLDRPMKKRLFDWQGWAALSKIINDEQPDIIQANAGDTLKFAVLSKTFFRWKTPVIFRNANKIGDFIDSRPKYLLNSFFMKKVSGVISVSEVCRQDFIQTFHWPDDRIFMVPIGIEEVKINDPADDVKKLLAGGPILVNVGSLVKEKNHEGLLRIFSWFLKAHPQARLLLVGNGPLKDQLLSLAAALEIDQRVHFLGSRTDVMEIVKAATAFVMPSLIEGLPGAILEAQYCKVPVIAYDTGGISEIVINKSTGWLVKKGDEDSFLSSLNDCLTAGEEQKRIIANAYQNVIDNFNNEAIAKRFAAAYQKFLGR